MCVVEFSIKQCHCMYTSKGIFVDTDLKVIFLYPKIIQVVDKAKSTPKEHTDYKLKAYFQLYQVTKNLGKEDQLQ